MVFLRLRKVRQYVAVAFSSLLILSSGYAFADSNVQPDVRLIIDISGSMKKNDPKNLRVPAVNLLTELVPEGSQVGVWTFGQWVNNLVKYQAVDADWRAMAKTKANEINSVALHTNIGKALETASADLEADSSNTHFILLTDGMV
ncbi:vWA domain-containing protein, partial [Oleiphilus sp. HI0066]|uniref:VWA domain-containing protein n=3 Tax=unclassified Oleiphilus TaxID=2631174 RepID=UPI0012E8FB51